MRTSRWRTSNSPLHHVTVVCLGNKFKAVEIKDTTISYSPRHGDARLQVSGKNDRINSALYTVIFLDEQGEVVRIDSSDDSSYRMQTVPQLRTSKPRPRRLFRGNSMRASPCTQRRTLPACPKRSHQKPLRPDEKARWTSQLRVLGPGEKSFS